MTLLAIGSAFAVLATAVIDAHLRRSAGTASESKRDTG